MLYLQKSFLILGFPQTGWCSQLRNFDSGDFDPMTALRELCVDVQPHKCFKQCKRGPNARLVQAGSQRGIMVDGMMLACRYWMLVVLV